MNDAHIHLIINHLPIILPIVGIVILLISFFIKNDTLQRTSYVIFISAAILTPFVMGSGEGAEEIVENLPGISENYIETHEEWAEKFALSIYILGLFSTFSLWANYKKKSYSQYLSYFVLIIAFVSMYLAKETGTSGGEIRHTEIRNSTSNNSNSNNNEHEEHEDDD